MKRTYVRGKPCGVVQMRLSINRKAYTLEFLPDALLLRQGEEADGTAERYRIQNGTCSCPAYLHYEGSCKHLLAIRKLYQHFDLCLK